MLQKFLRIYTIVVTCLILVALLGAGYCFFVLQYPVASVGCLFMAVIFALMLFVTRNFVSRNANPRKQHKGARF